MNFLFRGYDTFIGNFPPQYQGIISLGLLAVIIITLFQLVRKNLLWLILLVVLVPASLPIFSRIGTGLIDFLKYIVSHV
jgi:hypothetical protein